MEGFKPGSCGVEMTAQQTVPQNKTNSLRFIYFLLKWHYIGRLFLKFKNRFHIFSMVIKSGCLNALIAEPEKNVAQGIARLIAAIARHQVSCPFRPHFCCLNIENIFITSNIQVKMNFVIG